MLVALLKLGIKQAGYDYIKRANFQEIQREERQSLGHVSVPHLLPRHKNLTLGQHISPTCQNMSYALKTCHTFYKTCHTLLKKLSQQVNIFHPVVKTCHILVKICHTAVKHVTHLSKHVKRLSNNVVTNVSKYVQCC